MPQQAQGVTSSSPTLPPTFATGPVVYYTASAAEVTALYAEGNPVPKGAMLIDPTTRLIYGQSDGAGGFVALGSVTTSSGGSGNSSSSTAPLMPRQIINVSGSAANYIVRQRGDFRYGGFLVESGSALVTVRHGIVVGADIIYSNTVAPSGYQRLVEPLDLSEGLYVTLSANGRVTFFVSDNETLDVDDGLPPESGPVVVPMSATGRAWLGRGTYRGFNLNTQTTAGTGVKVYDGWDNTGPLVDVIAASVVGFMAGAPAPQWPVVLRDGCYIELLGTGQAAAVMMGEAA